MDPEARFRAVFDRAYAPLCRYACHRGLSGADAEDLVAQTLEIAWRRIDDMPVAEPLPWLYAIARNLWRNKVRQESRRSAILARYRALTPTAARGDPASLGPGVLRAALALLSDADQEVLRLVAWDGLTPAEVAVVLGCSPVAARSRLHRARGRLAALLGLDTDVPRRVPAGHERVTDSIERSSAMTQLDDDLLAALRAARPAPGYQPSASSPEASAMLARVLRSREDRAARRYPVMLRWRPRRLLLAGLPAVAAAAALAIVTLAPTGTPAGSRYQGAGPLGTLTGRAARPFLLTMAIKAARTQVTGRYWCTSAITAGLAAIGANNTELTPPGEGQRPSPPSGFRYAIISRSREESCLKPGFGTVGGFYQNLGARPATQADAAAWRRAGSPGHWRAWYGQTIHRQAGRRETTGAKPGRPSFGSYASLPANPAKLRAVLLAPDRDHRSQPQADALQLRAHPAAFARHPGCPRGGLQGPRRHPRNPDETQRERPGRAGRHRRLDSPAGLAVPRDHHRPRDRRAPGR